ncbi:MAG TPA: HAD family hydrolase [Candidatus Baltobacteraceae bacterium]|jgi:beta-phosphoglucomutase-like phosphatase (HAD superfamily)|nr:HAD family hydrolase [Candidatus Baltobacteraceae bacterium]
MVLSYEAVCFDLFGTLVEDDGSPIEGARLALDAVPETRRAIVTSCGRAFARTLLRAAALPEPAVLVSSDDVERTKPAPDCYALAARRLSVSPGSILVIEDSRHGIAAARAAGMDVIAILRGRPFSYASEALYAVERLADIAWTRSPNGSVTVSM